MKGLKYRALLPLVLLLILIALLNEKSSLARGKESAKRSPEEDLWAIPSFPPELKEEFLALLPTEQEIKTEIRRFKEARGYEPEAIVIGVPPTTFTKQEIRRILFKIEKLWEKGYQMELVWNMPEETNLSYAKELAKEIHGCSVPMRIYFIVEDPEKTLQLINPFLGGKISVWIRAAVRRSKLLRVPPSVDLNKMSFLLRASKKAYKGEGLPGIWSEGYGEGSWEKDRIYHGWILVYNEGFDHKYWFWIDCKTGATSGCREEGPSELEACDIHYMREMYFYGESGRSWGLICFPGCEPAINPEKCKGSCGVINTLWNGECNLTFSNLPLNERVYLIYASYIPTHTKKDPFPYFSYCGCFASCFDPQIFIIDIKYASSLPP